MYKQLKKIWSIALLFTCCQAMASDNKNTESTQTYTDPQKVIILDQTTSEFTIKLKSNPTTGYSWFLQRYDSRLISPQRHAYQPPQKNMPGAGGSEVWTFNLTTMALQVPHITRLQLIYARPWELENGTIVKFTVVTHSSKKS